MEAKRSSDTDLPDELVARIIAMMPFPSIFKARMLSKTWLARLSPIKSRDNEELKHHRATRYQARKCLATAFQKEVGAFAFQKEVLERSAKWPIFSSFKFGRSDSWAYELASHTWRIVPSLSFLPECIRQEFDEIVTAGALWFLCDYECSKQKMCIANIVSRSWKLLPPRPKFGFDNYLVSTHIVTNPSMQTYKVIIVLFGEDGHDDRYECYLQTYDSKSNAWSSKKLGRQAPFQSSVVHLNGVLYWTEGQRKLFAVDCDEGTLTELPLDGRIETNPELVVCNSCLVMVQTVFTGRDSTCKLMKIDLGSGRLCEIAVSNPPEEFRFHSIELYRPSVGHGDCIYFGFPGGVLTYNLPKDKWSCFDISSNLSIPKSFDYGSWKPCVFEPGLNLFAPV